MADNVDVTPGTGATVAADDVGGALYQRVKIAHGADGSATDTSSGAPLPVTISGVATAANQTTIIGHVDGIETLLTAIDGHVDGVETALAGTLTVSGTVAVTGVATAANQSTIIGHVDGIETLLTTIDGHVDGIEGALGGTLITKDAGINATTALGVTSAVVVSADATTPVAVTGAPTSGQKLVIWDIIASSDTEMWLELEEESSGTVLFKVFMAANSTVQITPRGRVKLAVADKKLMLDTESAGNVAVTCIYSSES